MAKEGKEKKKGSCLKTILIVIVIIVILGVIASIAGGDDQPKKVGEANTETVFAVFSTKNLENVLIMY